MTKAVLTTKLEPAYDDLPESRYHFPRTYLRTIESAIGDWIVYYEPRRTSADPGSRGGRQCYFAVARLTRIRPDPRTLDHFFADVSDYLEFERAVPFKEGEHYYELALRRPDGGTSKGAFGRAVRSIPDNEYDMILKAGFTVHLVGKPSQYDQLPHGFSDEPAEFERPIVESVTKRPFRDAAFTSAIRGAYHDTCAFTGLRIINGGGRPEVQAAHIQPVAQRGPDSIRNGLALCSTIHWMFDRGLLSLEDDYKILIAEGKAPDTIHRLINVDHRLRVPERHDLRPHPQYLKFHRETIFHG
jgi:putative restriction endonuclease